MKTANSIDYAEARRTADALCCRIAFGDEDPAGLIRQASPLLRATRRHRVHLEAKRRWRNS